MKLPFLDPQKNGLKRSPPFLLYFVVTLLVVALYIDRHDWLENLELKIQDKMVQLGRQKGRPNRTVIVTIDDPAIDKIGEWPWDAERIGYLIGTLAEYKPAAIGLDIEFPALGEQDSATDAFLAQIIKKAGNVVVPLDFLVADKPIPGTDAPSSVLKSTYIITNEERELLDHPPLQAHRLRAPSPAVAGASWSLGHINSAVDPDGIVRSDPLMIKFAGDYYPSMAVQLARAALGIHRAKMKIDPGDGVRIGQIHIPTDDRGRMLIEYWGGPRSFPTFSAARILEGKEPPEYLKGKVVLVGVTASGYVGTLRTPTSPLMHRTERLANAVESILRQRFIAQLNIAALLELAILVAIGLFCAVVLPRITLEFRLVVLAVFLFVIVNLNYILYSSFHLVTKTLYPSIEILLFLLFSPVVKLRKTAADTLGDKPTMGQPTSKNSSIKPGVRSVGRPGDSATVEPVTRSRIRGGAITKDELAETQVIPDSTLQEVGEMTPKSKPAEESPLSTPVAPADTAGDHTVVEEPEEHPAPQPSIVKTPQSGELPEKLGRYEVIEIVGQGAMGTVYRGKDPAIDRPVALKTIRFSSAAGSDEIAELRERLYREARAAGKLSHPNIVTIYDVGSEGDLQYIAMEFLEGYTLGEVVSKKQVLNYKLIAKIIMQVCSALDYAHRQGIVHRDIKPANIMVLDNFEAKVADFGIARLNQPNMTMTQTGTALGTPNYISPELLKGEKVDHRSDIFSLGVVIYELVTRQKPFTGENISQLIYAILNNEPEKPSVIDSNTPGIFDMVTARCLAKDPYERYQSAGEIAADLVDFVTSFSPKSYTF